MTSDIQAGRALTLISILAGILGFLVTLLGGGVANCSGSPPDQLEPPSNYSSRKKVRELCFYHSDCINGSHLNVSCLYLYVFRHVCWVGLFVS